jgi:hypothetical protein
MIEEPFRMEDRCHCWLWTRASLPGAPRLRRGEEASSANSSSASRHDGAFRDIPDVEQTPGVLATVTRFGVFLPARSGAMTYGATAPRRRAGGDAPLAAARRPCPFRHLRPRRRQESSSLVDHTRRAGGASRWRPRSYRHESCTSREPLREQVGAVAPGRSRTHAAATADRQEGDSEWLSRCFSPTIINWYGNP